ncbi:hypothetical protein D9M68_765230 [compost metagenome]
MSAREFRVVCTSTRTLSVSLLPAGSDRLSGTWSGTGSIAIGPEMASSCSASASASASVWRVGDKLIRSWGSRWRRVASSASFPTSLRGAFSWVSSGWPDKKSDSGSGCGSGSDPDAGLTSEAGLAGATSATSIAVGVAGSRSSFTSPGPVSGGVSDGGTDPATCVSPSAPAAGKVRL